MSRGGPFHTGALLEMKCCGSLHSRPPFDRPRILSDIYIYIFRKWHHARWGPGGRARDPHRGFAVAAARRARAAARARGRRATDARAARRIARAACGAMPLSICDLEFFVFLKEWVRRVSKGFSRQFLERSRTNASRSPKGFLQKHSSRSYPNRRHYKGLEMILEYRTVTQLVKLGKRCRSSVCAKRSSADRSPPAMRPAWQRLWKSPSVELCNSGWV